MKKRMMSAALVLAVCTAMAAEPSAVFAADSVSESAASVGEAAEGAAGLKVALCLSGVANDQGWNQSALKVQRKPARNTATHWTIQRIWIRRILPLLLLIMPLPVITSSSDMDLNSVNRRLK